MRFEISFVKFEHEVKTCESLNPRLCPFLRLRLPLTEQIEQESRQWVAVKEFSNLSPALETTHPLPSGFLVKNRDYHLIYDMIHVVFYCDVSRCSK